MTWPTIAQYNYYGDNMLISRVQVWMCLMLRRVMWSVLPLLMLLAACGGEDVILTRDVDESSVPDACTLVSEADFRALTPAIGTLTVTAEGSDDGLYSSCSWQTSDSAQFISLTIWRGEGEAGGVAEQFLAIQRDGLGEQHAVDSFGTDTILAGNEAAWSLSWHSGDALTVLITTVGVDFDETDMISLGEKVEEKLN